MQGLTDLHDKSYQGQFWLICKCNFGFKGTLSLWKEQLFILEYFIESIRIEQKEKRSGNLFETFHFVASVRVFVCLLVPPPSEHNFQLILDILSISNTTEDYDADAKGTI